MFVNNEDRIVHALESIADSQMEMVELLKKAWEITKKVNKANIAIMNESQIYDGKIPIKMMDGT